MVRALVTGAAGFFGHHLVAHLLENTDWHIVALVRVSKVGTLSRLIEVGDARRVTLVHHDLRSPINPFVSEEIGPVDYVFHVGAETHVDRSIENPLAFVESNVLGTVHLMEWARQRDLALFNLFSTDEVYGPRLDGAAREGDAYNARNPYAASKAGAEQMAVAYQNTYGLPVFITNTMNLFGERQHPEKFIPLVISKVLAEEVVSIHADSTRTRPGSRFYIHARDAADGLLFATSRAVPGDRFNIVGQQEVDNLTLARAIADILGMPLYYELTDFHSSRPGHDLRYALDGSKMEGMGWIPPLGFEMSLERTVRWTLQNPRWLLSGSTSAAARTSATASWALMSSASPE